MGAQERIDALKEQGDSIYAARAPDAFSLYDRAESTYYHVQLLATE